MARAELAAAGPPPAAPLPPRSTRIELRSELVKGQDKEHQKKMEMVVEAHGKELERLSGPVHRPEAAAGPAGPGGHRPGTLLHPPGRPAPSARSRPPGRT